MNREKCRDCPVETEIAGPGIMEIDSSTLMKCCRVQGQIEVVKQLFAERGKINDYNS